MMSDLPVRIAWESERKSNEKYKLQNIELTEKEIINRLERLNAVINVNL